MREMYKVNSKISTVAIITILIISLVLTLSAPNKGIILFSDKLFTFSAIIGILGATIAIVANSRMHYYLYIRKKNKGDKHAEREYHDSQRQRENQSKIGLSLLISAVIGIITSLIVSVLG